MSLNHSGKKDGIGQKVVNVGTQVEDRLGGGN